MGRHLRASVAAALAIVAWGGLAACGDAAAPDAAETPAPEQAEIDRLRALGYVAYGDEAADEPGAPPVRDLDAARSAPGYTLIGNRAGSAQLVDRDGRVVHAWSDPGARHWANAELLADGSLLVAGSRRDADGSVANHLLRLAWNGATLWRADVDAHHDAERTPDGAIAALTQTLRRIPAVHPDVDVEDHEITLLDDAGAVIERHSLYDLLASAPEHFTFQPVQETERKGSRFVDLLHANSVEWMRHPRLAERDPLYAPTNVVVSFRHQDTVAIFDWSAKRLVWAWGQGEVSGQHDATVLDNGNLLIFDNGLASGRSRVVELDPLRREIVWQHPAAASDGFFTLRNGASQRLPNGNTLITVSDVGEAFEVTSGGDVVWRYVNPLHDERGRRAVIVRAKRYPAAFVARRLGAG